MTNIYTVPNITDQTTTFEAEQLSTISSAYKCTVCGITTDDIDDKTFPSAFSHLYVGWKYHLPICKNCIDKLYDTYTLKYHMTEEEAVRRICALYDVYYCQHLVDLMKTGSKPNKRMSFYLSKTLLYQYANKTYANTLMEEKKLFDETAENNIVSKDSGINKKDYDFWGFGFESEEIDFLNNKFKEWVDARGCEDHSQEVIYKQICMLELQILKHMQSGQPTAPLQKQLNEFMNSGKLQPKQNDDSSIVEANTFGTFIKKLENERPVSQPAKEWEDVDKIKHYISVWFLGHLCKMIGINNKFSQAWSDLYENEVEKFTVNPPTYFDTDGEAPSFDDVFNK